MITSPLLPTDEEFDAIRDRLLDQVDEFESRPALPHLVAPNGRITNGRAPRRRRRRVLFAAGSVAAAGVLATALTVTGGFGIAGGIASAQAATVLHQASTSAFAATDPAVGPGQYLKFATHELARVYIGNNSGNGLNGHFTYSQTWTIFQPGTTTDDWVLVRATQAPSDPVGGEATHNAFAAYVPDPAQNGIWVGKNGHIADWSSGESVIQTLPRTEAAVRTYLYAQKVDPNETWSADQQAWERGVDLLRSSYVPAQLRGDLYEAMTTIPGVTVTNNQATIDGATGVAIGYSGAHNEGESIVIDPKTGQYLGSEEVGDVTSVSVSVVDSAPAR